MWWLQDCKEGTGGAEGCLQEEPAACSSPCSPRGTFQVGLTVRGHLCWQPLGESKHARQIEGIARLAGLLHSPALSFVTLPDLLQGRAQALASLWAPRARLRAEPPLGRAHLHGQVVAGATVVVLVQHLGDIAVVKLVAGQADWLSLRRQHGHRHQCQQPDPTTSPGDIPHSPAAWLSHHPQHQQPCWTGWAHGNRAGGREKG